jgi:hypothetical protein
MSARSSHISMRVVTMALVGGMTLVLPGSSALANTGDPCLYENTQAIAETVAAVVRGDEDPNSEPVKIYLSEISSNSTALGALSACLNGMVGNILDGIMDAVGTDLDKAVDDLWTILDQVRDDPLPQELLARILPYVNTAQEGIGALIVVAQDVLQIVAVTDHADELYQPIGSGDVTSDAPLLDAAPDVTTLSCMTIDCGQPIEKRRHGAVRLEYHNVYGDELFENITGTMFDYDGTRVTWGYGDHIFETHHSLPAAYWRFEKFEEDVEQMFPALPGQPQSGWAVKTTPLLQAVVDFPFWDSADVVLQEERPYTRLYGYYDGKLESEHVRLGKRYTCSGLCE